MTDLSAWTPCDRPGLVPLTGRYIRLSPFEPAYAQALFAAVGGNANDDLWEYVPFGPFASADELAKMVAYASAERGWQTMVLSDPASGDVLGMVSYMRIRQEHGSAEIGAVIFSKRLQRTRMATEAIYLTAKHAFEDLGYRRFEWKCNKANQASMRAAERFGFAFEGVFRNDMVVKGKSRDSAWFSMTDSDWPSISTAFETWLDPANFDADGQQLKKLVAGQWA